MMVHDLRLGDRFEDLTVLTALVETPGVVKVTGRDRAGRVVVVLTADREV